MEERLVESLVPLLPLVSMMGSGRLRAHAESSLSPAAAELQLLCGGQRSVIRISDSCSWCRFNKF